MDLPISTTPPLNKTDYNAIAFSLWKQLGSQVLIKSNINNWLKCDPGIGSLVDWKSGTVNCKINQVNQETFKFSRPPPSTFFSPGNHGPMPKTEDCMYYYYDGYTRDDWPILVPRAHDSSDLWQESRALAGPNFLSMRRLFVSYFQPIRFASFDGKSVIRGLPVLDPPRALDSCHRSKELWALGTRM